MSTAMPMRKANGIQELVTDAQVFGLGFSVSTVNYTLLGISAGYPLVPPERAPLPLVIYDRKRRQEQESGDHPCLELPVQHYDEPTMGYDRGDDSPTDRGVVIIDF